MTTAPICPMSNRGRRLPSIVYFLAIVVICSGLVASCNSGGNNNRQNSQGYDVYTQTGLYKNDGFPSFASFGLDRSEISGIQILGGAGSHAHLIPSDHISFTVLDPTIYPSPYVLHAPADGYLVAVDVHPQSVKVGDGSITLDDYGLLFQYSKNFFVMLGHVIDLTPDLKKQLGTLQQGESNFFKIPFKAGDEIGRVGGAPLHKAYDFWTIDMNTTVAGYVHPQRYIERSQHTVAPLDYFAEPLRSQLYAMLPDRPEPRIGQFAYDIDGKLVGNWFRLKAPIKENVYMYEDSDQLGFFYYNYDPSRIRIGYGVTSLVYWVVGDSPDPATIDVSSGLVKYKVTENDYLSDIANFQNMLDSNIEEAKKEYIRQEIQRLLDGSKDTLLVQMIEARKIKVELFPGKSADEVNGFTDAATFYDR